MPRDVRNARLARGVAARVVRVIVVRMGAVWGSKILIRSAGVRRKHVAYLKMRQALEITGSVP
jgi:hypothetical protein